MKTLFALSLIPALTNGLLFNASLASNRRSRPTRRFWPTWMKSNVAEKTTTPPQAHNPLVEAQGYHSLMINAARYYSSKDYARSLANYRRVLADRPHDVPALSGEAWSLFYLGQGEQAAKDFQAILKQNADDSWAREGMVLCSRMRKAKSSAPSLPSASTPVCA